MTTNNLESLLSFCKHMIPRALTQACRDPNNPAYGCFDRNWWHYKMRDFPSIILQQGGYLLHQAKNFDDWSHCSESIKSIVKASCLFWAKRALKRGAFEEYYPFEQGYPPLAFSTLAVMKMAYELPDLKDKLRDAAKTAAKQLENRFESQAANQQVAGLAAYAWLGKVFPELFQAAAFQNMKIRTLKLQHDEGWFVEYGGPDLGYLSVTLDCLWDLADATGDAKYIEAGSRALRYMEPYIVAMNGSIGMHNSRNTDYIVPYGVARFLGTPDDNKLAEFLLNILFRNADKPDHFLQAIDDRYLCHYIGHSIVRACQLLKDVPLTICGPEYD
jgi:hypothetical protein